MKKLILLLLILFALCSCSPFLDFGDIFFPNKLEIPSWLIGRWVTKDESLIFNFADSQFSIFYDEKSYSSYHLINNLGCKITEEWKSDSMYWIEIKTPIATYDFTFMGTYTDYIGSYILLTINKGDVVRERLFFGRLYQR